MPYISCEPEIDRDYVLKIRNDKVRYLKILKLRKENKFKNRKKDIISQSMMLEHHEINNMYFEILGFDFCMALIKEIHIEIEKEKERRRRKNYAGR